MVFTMIRPVTVLSMYAAILDRGNHQERRERRIARKQLTRVIHMKLVDNALISTAENNHKVLKSNCPVSMSGSWLGSGRICDPLPLQHGCRHDDHRSHHFFIPRSYAPTVLPLEQYNARWFRR